MSLHRHLSARYCVYLEGISYTGDVSLEPVGKLLPDLEDGKSYVPDVVKLFFSTSNIRLGRKGRNTRFTPVVSDEASFNSITIKNDRHIACPCQLFTA
jgi:hypothetical protein